MVIAVTLHDMIWNSLSGYDMKTDDSLDLQHKRGNTSASEMIKSVQRTSVHNIH